MPFTLTMPKLSPTMEIGVITKWHKSEGDEVEVGDLLMEVSTDKATVEHAALDSGFFRKTLAEEGSEVLVNQPIAIFTEEKGESIEGYKPEAIVVKPIGEKEETAEEPQPVQVQPKTKRSSSMAQAAFTPEPPLQGYTFSSSSQLTNTRIVASPLAKKLAEEKGLDLSTIKGSGPNGRIVKDDLSRAQSSGVVAFGRKESPDISPGTFSEENLTPMRKVISQRLQEAKTFIPHFYVTQTVNVEPLVAMREQLRSTNIKVSYNDIIIRACALALREYPEVNSGFNSVNSTIIRFKTIDISVAVSLPEGLITPIIRHADYKNIGELSVEIRDLAKRAKEGHLELHEYKGGSFTVSNLGMFGITDFQAILNPPQAAILAVSGIEERAVVRKGVMSPGKTMNISLSCDHRVIDGVLAAKFIKTVQNLLENPAALLI